MTTHLTNEIKSALKELNITPNKRLGQNFLLTVSTYQKIVSSLNLSSDDTVLEVGPGIGTLTKFLAETGCSVLAVEKDKNLIQYLIKKFASMPNVKIIGGDILEFKPAKFDLTEMNYKLVGNIPYYLTSRLLRIVFESWPTPKLITFMMQSEVAQKIRSTPPDMTLLSVSVQYYSKPRIIANVPAGNFYPPPDVDSAIVQFTPHEHGIINKAGVDDFFAVVSAGFKQKRKQLINILPKNLNISKEDIFNALTKLGIDPKQRAETLTISQWQQLTNQLYSRH
jgi:16S rRNA (adenine1518-N6/adenine1519-N6)-dimethyltransferase